MMNSVDEPVKKSWMCEQCGLTFHLKASLTRHLRFHVSPDVIVCSYCSFSSKDAGNVRKHMLRHFESKRNFLCELCGMAFHAKITLERHKMYKHSNIRPFSCTKCSDTFKTLCSLNRHKKVHETSSVYTCWCGHWFKLAYNFHRHKRVVHGEISTKTKCVDPLDSSSKSSKPYTCQQNLKTTYEDCLRRTMPSVKEAANTAVCNLVDYNLHVATSEDSLRRTIPSIKEAASSAVSNVLGYNQQPATPNEDCLRSTIPCVKEAFSVVNNFVGYNLHDNTTYEDRSRTKEAESSAVGNLAGYNQHTARRRRTLVPKKVLIESDMVYAPVINMPTAGYAQQYVQASSLCSEGAQLRPEIYHFPQFNVCQFNDYRSVLPNYLYLPYSL